jgi:hypothetical protein
MIRSSARDENLNRIIIMRVTVLLRTDTEKEKGGNPWGNLSNRQTSVLGVTTNEPPLRAWTSPDRYNSTHDFEQVVDLSPIPCAYSQGMIASQALGSGRRGVATGRTAKSRSQAPPGSYRMCSQCACIRSPGDRKRVGTAESTKKPSLHACHQASGLRSQANTTINARLQVD